MSDNDFIIIDEEKETPVTTEGKESSDTEKKEVFQTSTKEEHEDEYEKICFICHRPESVTGKTNYLINNDVQSASSKNKKAKELNVPIISESQFLEMLETGTV